MLTSQIKDKYLNFFKGTPRNHQEIDPSRLVLDYDASTLFTSAGMQPLVPFLKGEIHPKGKRLVDVQPSFRSVDIEEVGDGRHTTYFEMLGNWSLGDYFKEEQLPWIYEFFTKELGFEKEKLWFSVFKGDKIVPKDEESFNIWKKIGIPENRILFYDASKNWWSMTGTPEKMGVGDIGGPDSEIFYDLGENLKLHEKSSFKNQECHPNCDCGRFIEIGNSVFIEFIKDSKLEIKPLVQKNVDFGGGVERIAMALENNRDIFKVDVFSPIIKAIEIETGQKYGEDVKKDRSFQIISDHTRAAVMIASEGIEASNKLHGYILRRLIRRAIFHLHILGAGVSGGALVHAAEGFRNSNKLVDNNWQKINNIISSEGVKFEDALERGIKKLTKIIKSNQRVDGKTAFDLYQTEGFPLELTLEILKQNDIEFSLTEKKTFKTEFEKHKNLSKKLSQGIFKGGLADKSPQSVRLHTATHLLLASLRKVLGGHVVQKGQNITPERSRFDFPNPEKLTDEEIVKVESLINGIVDKNLPVKYLVMDKKDALNTGAIHAFNESYPEKVNVYFVGEDINKALSKEFCGGPHVISTKEIGHVRIIKQEKIGSGIVRIYMKTS